MKNLNHMKPLSFPVKGNHRRSPKRKDFSSEAIAKREWRKENLNGDPYAVTPDTPEGRDKIEKGNKLVDQWTAWAKDYANAFVAGNPHIPEEDFHNAALWGMTEASRTYEESQGKFSTHATWHMRKQIQRLLSKNGRLMCRPRNWRFSLQRLMAELETMAHEGLVPSFESACDRIGLSQNQRGALRDMYIIRTKDIVPVQFSVLTDEHLAPLEVLIDREEFHQLRESMKKLPGIYVCVLIDTFTGIPMNQLEVKYGLSAPTLLRYKRRAIEWLKFHMGQGEKPPYDLAVMERFRTQEHPVKSGTMVPPN